MQTQVQNWESLKEWCPTGFLNHETPGISSEMFLEYSQLHGTNNKGIYPPEN